MNEEVFYGNLVQALIKSNFRFSVQGLSKKDLDREHDNLSSSLRLIFKLAPSILNTLGGFDLKEDAFEIYPAFDQMGVKQKLDKVREYSAFVCFKYLLAQPIIVSVVEADRLKQEDFVRLANEFDKAVIEMLEFTGKMGRTQQQMSVTGIMLFTFFDHTSAKTFIETTQQKCKIGHFWKKTWVLPWVIDVSTKTFTRHSGIPIIIPQILDTNMLEKTVFHS